MSIKKLANIGGISSIIRYMNMLTSNNQFFPTSITDIAMSSSASPYINAWAWDSGLGVKYSNPSTLPGIFLYGLKWNPAKNAIVGADYSNGFVGYPWSSGFGTKYANITMPGGVIQSFGMSGDGATVFVGTSADPWINAYPFSNISGFGAKYSNPSTSLGGSYQGVSSIDIKDSDTIFMTTPFIAPYIHAYAFSSGFGTRYANPSTPASYNSPDISYSSPASAVAVVALASPTVYAWSSGFGTKYADSPTQFSGYNISFSPSGQSIVGDGGQILQSYVWSAGFGTKHANAPQSSGLSYKTNSISFSGDGKVVGIGFDYSLPYHSLHSYSAQEGFGFKYSVPAFTTVAVNSIAFR